MNLEFVGYLRKVFVNSLPDYDCIYCVYVGEPRPDKKVNIRELLYIGKAYRQEGIRGRLSTHNKMQDFERAVLSGENVYFTYAQVERPDGKSITEDDILRAESALIYTQQPPLNKDSKESFNYDDTIVNVSGVYKFFEDGEWEGNDGDITINFE